MYFILGPFYQFCEGGLWKFVISGMLGNRKQTGTQEGEAPGSLLQLHLAETQQQRERRMRRRG